MNNDLVAYYDDYTKIWHVGFRHWCLKNSKENLILVRDENWVKENLILDENLKQE